MFDKSVIHLYYRHVRGDYKIKSPLKWSADVPTAPATAAPTGSNCEIFEFNWLHAPFYFQKMYHHQFQKVFDLRYDLKWIRSAEKNTS
ncbi:hypothetical protein HPULCUR_008362 [Helicostylum pulchrum]|uniref:Uncharacterized protein n=1 Tax=Helicostylum pulchrum TaxID=562976 RepID=A0ABP9Y7D8_9FUNG